MRRGLKLLGVTALVLLAFGLGAAYRTLRPGPVRLNQDAVVTDVPRESVTALLRSDAGRYLDIQPLEGDVRALFILYPGGLVRPQAYQWLGVALAPLGVRTLIPIMPFDLAVFAPGRAGRLLESLEEVPERVVIGGHSLGGAMAARYAASHSNRLDGLVLMGAYGAEADDLSELRLETLVLAAERDGLASLEQLEAGMARLPPGAELRVIRGAVHSFFGRYGPQRGDGIPTVTRAQAEADIALALRNYFSPDQP